MNPRSLAATFTPIAPGSGGLPLYRVVKSTLMRSIECGDYAAGQALPSETELAQAFGISIGTLRRAVDELVAEHILVRRQGRGTFVAVHNEDRFLFQFFHVERSDGVRVLPQVELVTFARVRIEEEEAEALQLRTGDLGIQIDNRLLLQGRAVLHDRITLAANQFRGLTERRMRDRPSTIYHLYQTEFGITVTQARERTRAVAADRNCARMLGVPLGTPVLQLRRTALTFGDRPVEYRVSTINTANHDYVQLLSRPI